MARTTISLPDELAERLAATTDLNVSAVCRDALVAELDRRGRVAAVRDEMALIDLEVLDEDTYIATPSQFVGRCIGAVFRNGSEICLYLTKRHRYAVVSDMAGSSILRDYDSLDDAEADGQDSVLLAQGAASLGEKRPALLDI